MPGIEDVWKNEKLCSLYDYDYSGVNDGDSSNEEEATIVIETDQSVSHKQWVTRRLVSYTDSSSEEDVHVDVNFDEPTDVVINCLLFKIEFQRNK